MNNNNLYSSDTIGMLYAYIGRYGIAKQVDVLLEEMAELQKALLNNRRGRPHNILEELADVQIMIIQMRVCFDGEYAQNEKTVDDWINEKLIRMRKKMESWK
ncbi:hypothetical protein [Candidatus Magnetaquicoccus inordinatus]|uniref:hypothetical protein n=1 Tax=Candidatus Magnetaquicoccus inordinatus TaxID=2496818 RepID=UPI00102C1C4E|nr:hypothetical protein [Candidatus Magnetaquicoccus inordinatus]